MNLHEHKEEFEQLISIVANQIGIPSDAVRRDYYIVMMLQNLQDSELAVMCVFKGGTSLSKCYPGTINRFSEDIDLTFIPNDDLNDKKYSKALKRVEDTMAQGFQMEKIDAERLVKKLKADMRACMRICYILRKNSVLVMLFRRFRKSASCLAKLASNCSLERRDKFLPLLTT